MPTNINPTTTIPTTVSTASQWIQWHQALKERYGKAAANTLWLEAWELRKSSQANTSELRSYLEDQGITIESGLFGYAADIFDEGIGMFTMTGKVGLYAVLALVLVVVVPIFILFINLARKPENIASTVASLKNIATA